MKFTTKLLSGAALAVALMNSANATLVDWTFTPTNTGFSPSKFTYDSSNDSVAFQDGTAGFYDSYTDGTGYAVIFPGAVTYKLFTNVTLDTVGITTTGTWNAGGGVSSGSFTSKLNTSSASATAVPEPEAYAMMLAGLGLVGFAARRKQQAA